MNFLAKTIKNRKMISKFSTHKIKRFKKYLRTVNWKENDLLAYIKVDYGLRLDSFGRMSRFINEGEYDNPDDFWLAFNAFLE